MCHALSPFCASLGHACAVSCNSHVQVKELTSEDVFEQQCKGSGSAAAKQLCFVAFLPDILDSGAASRKAYIDVLQKMAESFKERPYGYLWAAGGAHPALEAAVDVGGFGYPALVALSPGKGVYVPLGLW